MFGLSKWGRYKKVNLMYNFSKIEDLFEGVHKCNLYRSYRNPMSRRDEEECIDNNVPFHIKGKELAIGTRSFDCTYRSSKEMTIYIGNDLILRLPRGYDGNFVYYRIEKSI